MLGVCRIRNALGHVEERLAAVVERTLDAHAAHFRHADTCIEVTEVLAHSQCRGGEDPRARRRGHELLQPFGYFERREGQRPALLSHIDPAHAELIITSIELVTTSRELAGASRALLEPGTGVHLL